MKATAIAPSNIAFIKYWGRKNETLRIPLNGSISMNLSNLITTTTVDFSKRYKKDEVFINEKQEKSEQNRVVKHLNRIRNTAKIKTYAKVVSRNNFPIGTGLSSSASGFAALTVAAAAAAGVTLPEKQLSILARLGSGSSCRSIPDGFVEWVSGKTNETSYAYSLYKENYWNIVDIVVITGSNVKDVSSSVGQTFAKTSPFFSIRQKNIRKKIVLCKQYLKEKDFQKFGQLVEQEALELHAIYLTSTPSLIYLRPQTLIVMQEVRKWRSKGIPVYFTLNTGQDVHVICEKKNAEKISQLVKEIPGIKNVIINYPTKGAKLVNKHLF